MNVIRTCASCGTAFTADEKHVGKKLKCPKCGGTIEVVASAKGNNEQPFEGVVTESKASTYSPPSYAAKYARQRAQTGRAISTWFGIAGVGITDIVLILTGQGDVFSLVVIGFVGGCIGFAVGAVVALKFKDSVMCPKCQSRNVAKAHRRFLDGKHIPNRCSDCGKEW